MDRFMKRVVYGLVGVCVALTLITWIAQTFIWTVQ